MASTNQARRVFLELPEATEKSHHGTPDFRVRNKIFATLQPERGRAVLKLPVEMHQGLLDDRPDAFFTNGWSKQGWLELDLKQFRMAELRALATEAFVNVAPKGLSRSLGG